ncbi:hypothetical protein GY45DRAFT_962969 [Cubamyces sp. BRFM 1775]|nr:hypothetical protein GY45DRAFT_962969 [Cubamyces sp. BRFM 1775]
MRRPQLRLAIRMVHLSPHASAVAHNGLTSNLRCVVRRCCLPWASCASSRTCCVRSECSRRAQRRTRNEYSIKGSRGGTASWPYIDMRHLDRNCCSGDAYIDACWAEGQLCPSDASDWLTGMSMVQKRLPCNPPRPHASCFPSV